MSSTKIIPILIIILLLGLVSGLVHYNQRVQKEIELSIKDNKYLYVQGLEIKKVD